MTCFKRDLENQGCCNNWQNGIRTINGQYPDDNREFKIMEGVGILITPVTAGIKIINAMGAIEAGQNIEITDADDHLEVATTDDISISGDLSVGGDAAITGDASVSGDTTLDGNLSVNGNIYNQGASYESHMEQVYTNDDYIIMRDGAVAALGSGQYAGFQVKKYDGTNDGRLVIDNTGTARVGDVGDEQPLLTRSETGSLTDGQSLVWDSANSKAITQAIPADISTALAGKQNVLTFDATPTNGSSNPVTSDGVYDAIPIEWIEIKDVTLTSNITGVSADYTITLDHTISNINKCGISYILCNVSAYSTVTTPTWTSSTSNTIKIKFYNDSGTTVQAGARWRFTITQLK